MNRIPVLAAAAVLASTGLASGADLCPEMKDILAKDKALAAATVLALGEPKYVAADASFETQCIEPTALLNYKDAQVLITARHSVQAGHGETGFLSAYVIGARNGATSVLRTFADFVELGTWGQPGDIKAAAFDGSDAFTVESGGTFQGITYGDLNLFILRGDAIVGPEAIELYGDDSGYVENARDQTTVEGAFQIGKPKPNQISVTYKMKVKGKRSTAKAVFELDGDKWKVASGEPPIEILQSLR